MKKIMICFGTRPEAIKMCPLVKELKNHSDKFQTILCVTGQHKEMLTQVLDVFSLRPDYNLEVMEEKQTLFSITSKILNRIEKIFEEVSPDLVMVHGDTSTTFGIALAAYYRQIPIGHVEAGLRTYNIYSPFPEEFNRQAVGILAKYHFAPTESAKNNLLNEGKKESNIYVTGNTAIDALKTTIRSEYKSEILEWAGEDKLIILTAHRRENVMGSGLKEIFKAINRVALERNDIKILYPVHLNPQISIMAQQFLTSENIRIVKPLDVIDFHNIMAHAYLILTDSGGIQEEAPALKKPVLVMRDTTERPEGVEAGTLKLVGTKEEKIYKEFIDLLDGGESYRKMTSALNPYGNGDACKKIVSILIEDFLGEE